MKILVSYRGIPQSPGWATGDMVVKAFRELGHEVFSYGNYYQTQDLIEIFAFEDGSIDLHVFMECNDGDKQYTELKYLGARKKVSWTFDNSYYTDNLSGLLSYFQFDHHFLANPLMLSQFPNSHYLPYACDKDLHSRSIDYSKKHDYALIGSIRKDRKELQTYLSKRGINLHLIGGAFREQYIAELAASRCIINQNPSEGTGLLNMRTFEAPAAGALLFMERRDYDANPGVFEDNKNCIVFDSYDNLADRILDLEKDTTGLVENIRMAGQSLVLSKHTYVNRCEKLLKYVS
jgi:hypothetical protein